MPYSRQVDYGLYINVWYVNKIVKHASDFNVVLLLVT